MPRYVFFCLLLAGLLSGCIGGANGSTPVPIAGESGMVEQASPVGSATMQPDPTEKVDPGLEIVQITQSNAGNGQASWSPDGTQIAFVSDRSGTWEVWTMQANGENLRQITEDYGPTGWPTWTPDGQSLLFYAQGNGGYQLFSVGLNSLEIKPFMENDGDDFRPLLDAQGARLLFDRVKPGSSNHDIYIRDLESGQTSQLTSDPGYDSDARWSPDGRQVLFHSDRGQEQFHTQVYILDLSAGDPVQLTDGQSTNGYPFWSPDGSQIVYTSELEGNRDLWVMAADGDNKRRLTFHAGFDGDPAWSPDGRAILFTTDRFGAQELALLKLE